MDRTVNPRPWPYGSPPDYLTPKGAPKSSIKSCGADEFIRKYVKRGQKYFVIDTGASSNVLHEVQAEATLPDYTCDTTIAMEFDTPGGEACASRGVRVQVGHWDQPSDYILMPDTADPLISVGERCMFSGYNFIWVSECQPCMISPGGRYIVIFEVDANVPVWSPQFEKGDEFLGTFSFLDNLFRERCGIYINKDNEVCLHLPLDGAPTTETIQQRTRRRANAIQSEQSSRVIEATPPTTMAGVYQHMQAQLESCLLYTSDAAAE